MPGLVLDAGNPTMTQAWSQQRCWQASGILSLGEGGGVGGKCLEVGVGWARRDGCLGSVAIREDSRKGYSSAVAAPAPPGRPTTQWLWFWVSGLVTLSTGSLKCLLLHTPASLNSSFNLEDLQSFIPLRVRSQQHAVWEKHVLLLPVYVLVCKLFWAGTHFMCHVHCARLYSSVRLMLQKSRSATPSKINM